MVPWAHPSPNPKRNLDRFSRFAQLTAESRYTLQRAAPFPIKIVPFRGGSEPLSDKQFLSSTQILNPNVISIG